MSKLTPKETFLLNLLFHLFKTPFDMCFACIFSKQINMQMCNTHSCLSYSQKHLKNTTTAQFTIMRGPSSRFLPVFIFIPPSSRLQSINSLVWRNTYKPIFWTSWQLNLQSIHSFLYSLRAPKIFFYFLLLFQASQKWTKCVVPLKGSRWEVRTLTLCVTVHFCKVKTP